MTRAIASLAMYDHARQHDANDQLWAAVSRFLKDRGFAAPSCLDRSRTVEAIWRDPNLLFGQACGYPLVSDPDLSLRVVGIPVYDVPGGGEGLHSSYILVRGDDRRSALADFRGSRAAINASHSNSGYNLFRATIAPLAHGEPFFDRIVVTGSHRASIAAIERDEADIAAVDAITFAAVKRFEPSAAERLRILTVTASTVAPPFVTARSTGIEIVAAIRMALAHIVSDPALAEARATLFLKDIIPGATGRLAPIRALEIDAVTAGYPRLN